MTNATQNGAALDQTRRKLYKKWFDTVTLMLATIAIVFAVIQFIDSRIQKSEMREIAESMSTRFIGEFPKNMDNIIQVVSGPTKELDIMIDFPGYGNYSNPDGFKVYFRKILDLAERKVKVRMLVYDEKTRTENRARQLKKDFESKIMGSERFDYFFHYVHPTVPVPKNYEEFSTALTKIEAGYEDQLSSQGVEIRKVSSPFVFYLWLEDEEDGVFSFQNADEGAREISFRTRDGTLLRTLKETFERSWKAHPLSPSQPVPHA